jgi:hypothetical protein
MVDAFKVRHTRDPISDRLITLQPDFVAPVVGYLVSKGLLTTRLPGTLVIALFR